MYLRELKSVHKFTNFQKRTFAFSDLKLKEKRKKWKEKVYV